MAGLLTTESENLTGNMLFKNADVDRGTSLQIGLFTNSATPDNTWTLATITEPTGGSYARITLTDASWTVAASVASYAAQVFTATGSAMTGSIYGYFIATTGTTPRLLWVERDTYASVPYTLAQNDTYTITPSITIV